MKVAVRVDASPVMGTGHLMRCLTLADALKAAGANVRFVCRHVGEALAQEVARRGHELARLPDRAARQPRPPGAPHAEWLGVEPLVDAADTCSSLEADGPWDWLVVDHYALDEAWETATRGVAQRLMVIDDLADRPHDADLLLDQNLYANADDRYGERVAPECERLLGPRYALLRPEFAELRGGIAARQGPVKRLLVFFGGVDAANATEVALDAMAAVLPRGIEVDVVIGAGHPARSTIESRCAEAGHRCHVQTPRMAELMAQADLAIGAGGTATWERCALGLPALALCLADNQRELLESAARAGIVHAPSISHADAQGLARHLLALIESPGWRELLSAQAMARVDGLGAARVVRAMQGGRIRLRPAQFSDAADLLAWRNHPSIRAVSHDPGEISREGHERWLHKVLADPDRHLLIGATEAGPAGVVRFDVNQDRAEVSIYLVPGAGGRGLGTALLSAAERWLALHRPEVAWLDAEVRRDNRPSHRLFTRCGYETDTTRYRKRIIP